MDRRNRGMGQRPHPWTQFKARFLRTSAPTSTDGIEKYLSSGMIRGIGPVYAKKLVRDPFAGSVRVILFMFSGRPAGARKRFLAPEAPPE